jgi:ABC-type phosphate/phosphonate transport system ATPase subunit
VLTIRNLSKTYPNGVRALTAVNLDIPKPACSGCSGRTVPASRA